MRARYKPQDAIRKLFLESPLVRAIVDKAERTGYMRGLMRLLQRRFGAVPPTITAGLERVVEMELLEQLTDHAVDCDSLQSFERGVLDESLRPTPSKRRSKRRAS